MGRIASSEYHTVELHADNEEEEEPIHAEVILPVASKVATFNQPEPSSASELAQELTWADTFYEDEPDIVAVFDLDQNAISFYQRRAFYFAVYCTVGLWFLAGLYYSLDFQPVAIFFVCLSMGYVLMASKTWAKVQAATSSRNGGGIHIAISSLSVRYDQADPMVSTEISLSNISSCTIAQKKIRMFWCTPETTLNLVQLQIAGDAAPKVYIGLKDPKNFARLVMMLKNENSQQRRDNNNNNSNNNMMIV